MVMMQSDQRPNSLRLPSHTNSTRLRDEIWQKHCEATNSTNSQLKCMNEKMMYIVIVPLYKYIQKSKNPGITQLNNPKSMSDQIIWQKLKVNSTHVPRCHQVLKWNTLVVSWSCRRPRVLEVATRHTTNFINGPIHKRFHSQACLHS